MSLEDDNWDEEFGALQTQIDALKKRVGDTEGALEASEKRALLRFRGRQHCRVCGPYPAQELGKAPADPPISEWEQKFCDHGHGEGRRADPSHLVEFRRPPVTWAELEEQLAYYVSKGVAPRRS